MRSDQIIFTDEDRYLARCRRLDLFFEQWEEEDDEEIVIILINFGTLNLAQAVIQIQGMKGVVLGQILCILFRRSRCPPSVSV